MAFSNINNEKAGVFNERVKKEWKRLQSLERIMGKKYMIYSSYLKSYDYLVYLDKTLSNSTISYADASGKQLALRAAHRKMEQAIKTFEDEVTDLWNNREKDNA